MAWKWGSLLAFRRGHSKGLCICTQRIPIVMATNSHYWMVCCLKQTLPPSNIVDSIFFHSFNKYPCRAKYSHFFYFSFLNFLKLHSFIENIHAGEKKKKKPNLPNLAECILRNYLWNTNCKVFSIHCKINNNQTVIWSVIKNMYVCIGFR